MFDDEVPKGCIIPENFEYKDKRTQPAFNSSMHWKEVTKEEYLIQQAAKRYPAGTEFISARYNREGISNGVFTYYTGISFTSISTNGRHVYFKDSLIEKWAEIKTENTMEKKIKGYELVKSEYLAPARRILDCMPSNDHHPLGIIGHKDDIERLKNAGVLDIWFEPVYIETYNVGDWVYIEGTAGSLGLPLKSTGDIVQIDEISALDVTFVRHGKRCASNPANIKRLATESEYKKYLEPKVTIKGYTAKIGETTVTFGCQTYSKEFIIELANCLDNNGLRLMSSDTNYKEEILKLRDYYESR
jgi:hypothetical protein